MASRYKWLFIKVRGVNLPSDYPFHAYEDRASAEFDAVMLGAAKPQAYTYRIEEAASTDQLIAKGYTLAKAVPHA